MTAILIGLVLLLVAFYLMWREINGIDLCVGVIAGFLLAEGITATGPTAMDVYQGKTTLEITYKDGVAIDSVVVFKDKK